MKKILVTLALGLTVNSYATCADHFDTGITEYNFAARYFESGMNAYNEAVAMSRSSNPNFLAICNKLVDSVSGFSVAKNSYGTCESEFTTAIGVCSGQDSTQAAQNAEVCAGNKNIANDNLTTMLGLLRNTCYKGSGTTDLDVDLNSVLLNL
jgi:hypothetical protein